MRVNFDKENELINIVSAVLEISRITFENHAP